ncbi:type III polyketide synthase [Aurantiacibacter spongiae]|uniref:Type III polyketide synthase n=1 Tax=Aurantiacibacter spongiae TaxID=2488860 RepID=A0A3N5CTE8_9SPHN|nr:type III polyketide synthase [Aurantiacibacter spongiae]RPF70650.1 type III polyketide synthase [Aurantiacibacter spongiae]
MGRTAHMALPRINAIATALPDRDVHAAYNSWATRQIDDDRKAAVFARMMERSGIDHRYSVLSDADARIDFGSFYDAESPPGTAERMRRYADAAPDLALDAIRKLPELDGITHLVTASCTGFMAPGLDQVVARRLGLDPAVERVSIGFMGCYAGITLLRTAAHIVRSRPDARVLALSVELCTLHMQETDDLEALLAMGQFADGAAAAIVSGTGAGLALGESLSATIDDSEELITWTITDTGFVMHLSGAVPGRLADTIGEGNLPATLKGDERASSWAVHPGGRSILDAVERGLDLRDDALDTSRRVLAESGNMSSATVLFVLGEMMADHPEKGVALAFGPGLAMEGLRFGWTDGDAG